MEPVEGMPREWNSGADYLANLAMSTQSCGGNLNAEAVRQAFAGNVALQFFSDGGFNGRSGAFGVQLLAHSMHNGMKKPRMIGFLYKYVPEALSAFQMEILGLDAAVELLAESVAMNRHKRLNT